MHSKAITVEQYLNELPNGRKEEMSIVRQTIVENLPDGYDEVMNWGMITYEVPLETYPNTYNGKPLMYAGLASQKNHISSLLFLNRILNIPKPKFRPQQQSKQPFLTIFFLQYIEL